MENRTHLSPPHELKYLPKRSPQFGLLALLLFLAALGPLFGWFGWLFRNGLLDWVPVAIVGALGAVLGLMRQRWGGKGYGVAITLVLALYATAAMLTVVGIPELLVRHRFREVVTNPGGDFVKITGLGWPASAKVLAVDDDHGGFQGEGEFYLVFDASPETLKQWLARPAPWRATWQQGPVPHDIAGHCGFGFRNGGTLDADAEARYAEGWDHVRALLTSKNIWYVARERCCESLRWHNGELLAVEPGTGRVWLSSWDF
jgi:hypothetical protein